jgi:hypothetical protein
MARIQTFPDGLSVDSGRTEMQRMLGNAVPSLMAEILAREIRAQFLDAPIAGALSLLPKRNPDVPPSENPVPLPPQYRNLIGQYEPHAGTGRGPAALRRATKQQAMAIWWRYISNVDGWWLARTGAIFGSGVIRTRLKVIFLPLPKSSKVLVL